MRYRVELDELMSFVDRLQSFQQRAESLAARIDGQVEALHATWSGEAAEEHRARHTEWMTASTEMREALAQLRAAAHNAHQNYTSAGQLNVAMLT